MQADSLHYELPGKLKASKVMLKILQAWLQLDMNQEIPDVQAGFRKDQTTWPASWETYMQVRKQQLELDMEQ